MLAYSLAARLGERRLHFILSSSQLLWHTLHRGLCLIQGQNPWETSVNIPIPPSEECMVSAEHPRPVFAHFVALGPITDATMLFSELCGDRLPLQGHNSLYQEKFPLRLPLDLHHLQIAGNCISESSICQSSSSRQPLNLPYSFYFLFFQWVRKGLYSQDTAN